MIEIVGYILLSITSIIFIAMLIDELRTNYKMRKWYKENQKLKKQLENTINSYTEEHNLRHNSDLKLDLLKTQQKEFIKYLEDEKDRLARECSQIYEDSLGKTRLVSEDIFNEVNDILQKYKSIIGVLDE